jgi:hypothetical protein
MVAMLGTVLRHDAIGRHTPATLEQLPATVAGTADHRGSLMVQPMNEDRFWALIGTTAAFESDQRRQLSALRASLEKLSPDDIAAFDVAFNEEMKRSYSWDLWGAAYVVHGGASDDAFVYFRCWLISKGRAVFEKVIADPDSLADIADNLAPGHDGDLEFESFAYVAFSLWEEKTGRPATQMPIVRDYGPEPSGTQFQDDGAYLAKRYPKLWRRFGTHPLPF